MSSDNNSPASKCPCQLTRCRVPRAPLRRREQSDEIPYVPPELKGFPGRVEEARRAAGLLVSEAGTSRWERGIRLKKVTAVEIIRLARKLGVCTAGWIMTGEGDPPRAVRRQDPEPIRAEEVEE